MSRFDHLEMNHSSSPWPDDNPAKAHVDYHYFLDKANALFMEANYERALTMYSRSLEFDINLEEAWLGQIRCLIELHELDEAVIWADRALERLPNSAQILSARGIASLRINEVSTAAQYSDAAMAAESITPYVWIARGEVFLARSPLNSRACFMKAIELASSAETNIWIGHAYMAHDRLHEAIPFLRTAVKIDPELFISWYWMGLCLERLGEIDEAENAYHRAASANPSFAPARESVKRLQSKGIFWRIAQMAKRVLHLR